MRRLRTAPCGEIFRRLGGSWGGENSEIEFGPLSPSLLDHNLTNNQITDPNLYTHTIVRLRVTDPNLYTHTIVSDILSVTVLQFYMSFK